MKLTLIILAYLLLASVAYSASWSGTVKTDSDSWAITRESCNLSFTCEQSVQGQISPVDYRGRTLSPYYSYYKDVNMNDVRLKERTGALQGSYRSEEVISLKSSINNSVSATIYKPSGSDVYSIDFYEKWPVVVNYSKSMNYFGKEINDREFVGNNRDYVGVNFLYNNEFSKERSLKMCLERMNASILATDEAIDLAEVKATRDTQYRIQTHSTGVASFKWQQVDADYSILNEGDERFVGVYDITKNIRMKSRFENASIEDDWLPCCYSGWDDMRRYDQKGFGESSKGIFDCSCYNVPQEA